MFTALHHHRMTDEARPGAASSQFQAATSHFKLIEGYARFFARPEVRLRFLNNTLALQAERGTRLEGYAARWRFLRKFGLFERLLNLSLYGLIFREVAR